jgi:hypothetical protein
MATDFVNNSGKQIRILYVHYGENWIRGSEVVLLDILKSAKDQGHQPVLWCNSQILASKAAALEIEVIVDNFVCLGYWTKPKWDVLQFFWLLIKAKKLLKKYKISLVHCNNGAPCQWMTPICKLTATKVLLHLHAKYLYRDRLTLLFRSADSIVGVSQSVIESFKQGEFKKQQVSVIYNGIEPKRAISEKPRDIRAELSASASDFVILYIGSLIPRKSVHQILYALNSLNNDKIKLAIVGSGCEKENLQKLACKLGLFNHVKFFLPTDNVANVYSSNIDCLISVPLEEVFGLTLAEASIAKIPIITSNIAGINEIYSHNNNALLVSPNNTKALASSINAFISNPHLRNRLAENADAHIRANFSLQKQFLAFNDAYHSLLAREVNQGLLIMCLIEFKTLFCAFLRKIYTSLLLKLLWRKRHD